MYPSKEEKYLHFFEQGKIHSKTGYVGQEGE